MPDPLRLALFIDGQNAYQRARGAFFDLLEPNVRGQTDPMKLASLIAGRGGPGGEPCVVERVRVYTGMPSSSRNPRGYSANRRQRSYWTSTGCEVVARPLLYPRDGGKPNEKGIDVSLAIDFVRLGFDGDYDLGVIMSTDTDLIPAFEFVMERFPDLQVATAAWSSPSATKPVRLRDRQLWCYYLDQAAYTSVYDPTDYTL